MATLPSVCKDPTCVFCLRAVSDTPGDGESEPVLLPVPSLTRLRLLATALCTSQSNRPKPEHTAAAVLPFRSSE